VGTLRPSVEELSLRLDEIDAVVSDLDGVVWRGRETLPGVPEFFSALRSRGLPVVFATNNSGKTPAEYVERLGGLGVPGVEERDVVTSGVVTAAYLQEHYPVGAAVHVLGNPGLLAVIAAAGFTVTRGDEPAVAVVVSVARDLSFDKLALAASAVGAGADFIGTNGDPTLPVPGGLLPGSGSVIAAVEVASGRRARLLGKPEAAMFEHALKVLGSAPSRTLMIGDRLDTDILGAQRASLRTALVLTGSTTVAALAEGAVRPDLVCPDLNGLLAAVLSGRPTL